MAVSLCAEYQDDVIKWKHFLRYWPFVRGIQRVTGEFPSQRPVTRSFDIFFDPRLNKRLRKQSRRRWFETPSRSLWRHCNMKISLESPLSICLLSVNSVTPSRFKWNFRWWIFQVKLKDWWLRYLMKKSTLVHVMAWCCKATSHYLNLCWPGFMSP